MSGRRLKKGKTKERRAARLETFFTELYLIEKMTRKYLKDLDEKYNYIEPGTVATMRFKRFHDMEI